MRVDTARRLGQVIDLVQALVALGLLSVGIWARWGWPYAALVVGVLLWVDMIRRGRKKTVGSSQ